MEVGGGEVKKLMAGSLLLLKVLMSGSHVHIHP